MASKPIKKKESERNPSPPRRGEGQESHHDHAPGEWIDAGYCPMDLIPEENDSQYRQWEMPKEDLLPWEEAKLGREESKWRQGH